LHFALLGPLEVLDGGVPLPLGGYKSRVLLALLACQPNRPLEPSQLIDALWEGQPPRTAAQNLRTYVYQLRRTLAEDTIVSSRAGYALAVDLGQIDVGLFEEHAGQARELLARHDPGQAVQGLREALGIWRGPALADIRDAPSLQLVAARLEERRLAAVELRLTAEIMLGHGAALAEELFALTEDHPLRERFWLQLMLSLAGSGRRAEALAAYRRARQILVDELGVEPGPDLQRMHESILDSTFTGTAGLAPGLPPPGPGPAPQDRDPGAAGELRKIWQALSRISLQLDRLESGRPRDPGPARGAEP
jgi:DNA-binding SARP family transcriptional activator